MSRFYASCQRVSITVIAFELIAFLKREKTMKRDQSTTILIILIFSIAIMLSGSVFAADTTPNRVTQSEFNAAIANLQAEIDKLSTKKKVGDSFGGGIVFYVDPTGHHGLIASLSDQSESIQWYNGVYKVTGATGDGVGAGAANTSLIMAAQMADNPTGNFAAKVAADFSVQEDGLTACTGSVDEVCYGDWYLPSKHELNLLYQQKYIVDGFVDNSYWSSTELSINYAWGRDFGNDVQGYFYKDRALIVRAIRAF